MANQLYVMNVEALNDDFLARSAYDRLSKARKSKADLFVFRKDRNLSLGAGLLLDFALRSFGLHEKDMLYGVQKNQKPAFLNQPDMHFNLSHSGSMAICAMSETKVGCDIELLTDIGIEIAEHGFSKCEYGDIVSRASEAERTEQFFRYWSLKESFMKFTGLGMALQPDSFEIQMNPTQISVLQSGVVEPVCFTEYCAIPGYACAVCSLSDFSDTPLQWVTVAQALEE